MIVPVAWLQRVPTYKDQIAALGSGDSDARFPRLSLDATLRHRDRARNKSFPSAAMSSRTSSSGAKCAPFDHLYGTGADRATARRSTNCRHPGTDNREMSKSRDAMDIADGAEETTKKVRSMITIRSRFGATTPASRSLSRVALHELGGSGARAVDRRELPVGALGCVDCERDLAENSTRYAAECGSGARSSMRPLRGYPCRSALPGARCGVGDVEDVKDRDVDLGPVRRCARRCGDARRFSIHRG